MSGEVFKIDKGYVISDEGGWLPGVYESEEAAQMALQQKDHEDWGKLQRLQDESGGVITLKQLSE